MLKELLTFIKKLVFEDLYHTASEKDFIKEYIDDTDICNFVIDEEFKIKREKFISTYPYMPNPYYCDFYSNIYNSFKFTYDLDNVLDEIFCEGLTLNRAEALMSLCSFLSTVSTNAMIYIDDEFSFAKKYSLANDLHLIAKAMYDSMMIIHTTSEEDYSRDDVLSISEFEELENCLSCKYIRNGIAVLKLFHILALLQISPLHNDGVHKIAKKLIQLLREVLYDKRIIKMIVDTDLNGINEKFHKSTRIKIYFKMSNSDRYCIRLDLPHQGEENIHLNINEPAHKQSTGFPFNGDEIQKARSICDNNSIFDELFYFKDDMFWFRSNFDKTVKKIGKTDTEKETNLNEFRHDRGHLSISLPDDENIRSVSDFSAVFAEVMTEYEKEYIYGDTDNNDDILYQYMLFQDYIFDAVIKIKANDIHQKLLGDNLSHLDADSIDQTKLRSIFVKYIKEKFPFDIKLNEYADSDLSLCELLLKCLDCIDSFGV
ncbi:MAG: hypothetical protein J6A58_09585 [Oscillospiraceae bacterium]|nr:hypothetical protein [Oscillospiraceae bacterium]